MEEQQFYTSFSQRRRDLRAEWNNSIHKNWGEYVKVAELRAIKVFDALNKSIDSFTHKEILNAYNDLYKHLK